MSALSLSIIIVAKNEEAYIGRTLDMVFAQGIDKEYEVIVIDSGSKDSTLKIAKRYPVKIIEIPPQDFNHGRTRNLGAQTASGVIAVFLNADATPGDEKWLKNLAVNFENDEKIMGVYSCSYPRDGCVPLRHWEILKENSGKRLVKYIGDFGGCYQHMNPRGKRRLLDFQTISCAIRRDFLLRHPFYDMDFGEDLEWSKRVIEKGFKIVFEPRSRVLHSHNFYNSFIRTFKKYFDDSRLNHQLLNMWTWRDFPILFGHIAYKISKDSFCILGSDKGAFYKIRWLFYSPVIRFAEFLGTITGANSSYLPSKLNCRFSLVNEIKGS